MKASFTVFGQRLKVLRLDACADIAYVYGWRDVVARPVTLAWLTAAPQ